MPSTTEHPAIKLVKLDELVIDKRYQRPLHEATVKKITSAFDPVLCGVLEVSAGPNGSSTFAVFDGQHRLAALRLLGEREWPCRIHKLDAKRQAAAFVQTQTERRPVHPLDRHKAAVFSGDELAIKVDNLAKNAGYRITNASSHGALQCVGALTTCYTRYGPESLKLALRMIEDAWGLDDHYSRKAPMVIGMTLLMSKHAHEMDLPSFTAKLSGISSSQILRQAMNEQRVGASGTTAAVLVARQLLETYNSGRRVLTAEQVAEGQTSKRISPRQLGRGA